MEDYEVLTEPSFRIKFRNYFYKKDGKIKRNLKGNYRCEIKSCEAKAFIDRDGLFHLVPGFEKHRNHENLIPELVKYCGSSQFNEYSTDYCVLKKPLRVILGTNTFIKEVPDNKLLGYYRCKEVKCPVRVHIDEIGRLRILTDNQHNIKLQHRNHKPCKYKNNYSYIHWDMKRFYWNAIPEPNCTILENPLRVIFRGEVYVKDGKIGYQYQGNYKCAVTDCPSRLQIGYYADVRLFNRYGQDHTKVNFHRHPKPQDKDPQENPVTQLLEKTLDVNRFPKKTLENFNIEVKKKPEIVEKDEPKEECPCKTWEPRQLKNHKCDEYLKWIKTCNTYFKWPNYQ